MNEASKAKADQEAAVEAERRRIAATKAAEEAEAARREADKKHQAKINGEVLAALVASSHLTEDQAKDVVRAVARHEIPHVSISY